MSIIKRLLFFIALLCAPAAFAQYPNGFKQLCSSPTAPATSIQPNSGDVGTDSRNGLSVANTCIDNDGNMVISPNVLGAGTNQGTITLAFYLSPNCNGASRCTTINADGNMITDGTANSTATVTCPNSDCNFTSADVGKTFWATTQGSGAGTGFLLYTTFVCPVTTIATVVSPQSVTLNNSCTASGTANTVFIWGHKDGATIAAAVNAAGCSTIYFPSGIILDDQPWGNTPTTPANCHLQQLQSSLATPEPLALGQPDSTMMIVTPDFNYAGCTGSATLALHPICIGASLGGIEFIEFWGTGLTAASNANCPSTSKTFTALVGTGGSYNSVDVAGICPGAPGDGVDLNSIDQFWYEGGAQEVFTNACVGNSPSSQSYQLDCLNTNVTGGIGWLQASGVNQDLGTYGITTLSVASGAIYQSHTAHFDGVSAGGVPAVSVSGTWTSDGDFVGITGATFNALQINSGGKVQSRATTWTNCSASGSAIANVGGVFIDQGGNIITLGTCPGGVGTSASGTWRGDQILTGACTGTVTASTSVALYGAGQNTASACTVASAGAGIVMNSAGTALGLHCTAGTAGSTASSACTAYKNGVAQTMTCSLNGATSCFDQAHTFTYTFGDILAIVATAGAADTLAAVKGQYLTW